MYPGQAAFSSFFLSLSLSHPHDFKTTVSWPSLPSWWRPYYYVKCIFRSPAMTCGIARQGCVGQESLQPLICERAACFLVYFRRRQDLTTDGFLLILSCVESHSSDETRKVPQCKYSWIIERKPLMCLFFPLPSSYSTLVCCSIKEALAE